MKFYVKSHELEVVVAAPHIQNAEDAACEAFLTYYTPPMTLSRLTIVSERGFDWDEHDPTEDYIFNTLDIFIKAGFTFEDK